MDFQDRLELVKKEVEKELVAFFSKKRKEAKQISPHCTMLIDQVESLTLRGGKRTRAFLCWLGHHSVIARSESSSDAAISKKYEIASPSEWTRNDTLLSAMLAIELFQSFALIHDDIIDQDAVRRGGPTVHEAFRINAFTHLPRRQAGQLITPQNALHFGESLAILAGDLALVWADELMGKVGVGNIYTQMKQEVIYGQSLDVLVSTGLPSTDRVTINRYKTAWYTVIRPLQIGASLGGTDEKTLESFIPYGLAVGEAYQLRDDILDGAIQEHMFQKQAGKLQKQAAQAIEKLNVSQSTVPLFGDFARFALYRPA